MKQLAVKFKLHVLIRHMLPPLNSYAVDAEELLTII
jgi:hypothetical protein